MFIDPEVALSIVPQEVQSGLKFASFSGLLDVRDNVHNIHNITDDNIEGVPKQLINSMFKKQVTYEYGPLDIDTFLKKLKQDGISDVKITQTSESDGVLTKIKLSAEEIEINISEKGTHIICEGKQSSRLKVRDLLLSCMNKF